MKKELVGFKSIGIQIGTASNENLRNGSEEGGCGRDESGKGGNKGQFFDKSHDHTSFLKGLYHAAGKRTSHWPAEECVREEEKMFANLVVELKKHHYSQRGLAAYIGISESSMNDKMNGRTQFTMREAKAIQAVFEGRTLDYLFEEKE